MRGAAMPGNFRKPSSAGQYIGLGLSFGVTMLVNVAIAAMAGRWLDSKLERRTILAVGGTDWYLRRVSSVYRTGGSDAASKRSK